MEAQLRKWALVSGERTKEGFPVAVQTGRVGHSKTDRSPNFSPHTEGKHTHKKTKANQS